MQGRNKKGSNLVTHRVNWSGIKLKLGEDAVGSTIQMNINKYPIIVQEYLASHSWAVPEVLDKYTVHKCSPGVGPGVGNLAADKDSEWLGYKTKHLQLGFSSLSQREALRYNEIMEEKALWKQQHWLKIPCVAPVNPVFAHFPDIH